MELVAEYLVQSVLEQYLVCGAGGKGPLAEAFGWGWSGEGGPTRVGVEAEAQEEEEMLSELFREEGMSEEVEGWREVLEEAVGKVCGFVPYYKYRVDELTDISQITPSPNESFTSRLQSAAKAHPVAKFDANLLNFIHALQHSLSLPLIAQLESDGAIDGLSLRETEAFKSRVGLRA